MWGGDRTRTLSPGVWANDLLDWIVPGKIERFLPLPRYHPWLFGVGMLGWGMARQAAIDRGSRTYMFGLEFPMFADTVNASGGLFGRGTARGVTMVIATFIAASVIAQTVQEAN